MGETTEQKQGQQVGYIRVSSVGQNTARQLDGVQLDRPFVEKASGKDARNRPELQACLDYLRDGDTLHVHSIDRLARSLRDLESIVAGLTERGVSVRFHKEGLEFGPDGKDGQGAMGKLMFQVLGAFAEFERTVIRERQAEGIAKARAEGKYRGRARAISDEQARELAARVQAGESKAALARELGICRHTVHNAIKAALEAEAAA